MLSDATFATLNTVYLKKMATAEAIAEATGQEADAVRRSLDAAQAEGLVMDLPTGAMLMPDGTARVLDYYRINYAGLRAQPVLLEWYAKFETLNTRFIGQVSEWQKSEGDERVERRLLQSAERLAKDIGQLVPQVPRYAGYVRRLERSMERVDQGERDWVCKPTLDSVHNIWFEFHEDILAVLGRPRDTT